MSRWLTAGLLFVVAFFVFGGIWALQILGQWPPSSIPALLIFVLTALMLWVAAVLVMRLVSPPQLLIYETGLKLRSIWNARYWRWSDISTIETYRSGDGMPRVLVKLGERGEKSRKARHLLPWGFSTGEQRLVYLLRQLKRETEDPNGRPLKEVAIVSEKAPSQSYSDQLRTYNLTVAIVCTVVVVLMFIFTT